MSKAAKLSKNDAYDTLEYHAMAQVFYKIMSFDDKEERHELGKAKVHKIVKDAESDFERYLTDKDDPDYSRNLERIKTSVSATFMVFAAAVEALASDDQELADYIEEKRQTCRVLNL